MRKQWQKRPVSSQNRGCFTSFTYTEHHWTLNIMLEKRGRGWSKNEDQFNYTNKKKKNTDRNLKWKDFFLETRSYAKFISSKWDRGGS